MQRIISIMICLILLPLLGCVLVNPTTLDFGSTETTKTFTLNVIGDVEWSITPDESWVTVDPDHGQETQTITVNVNRSGLDIGSYETFLTITTERNVPCSVVLIKMRKYDWQNTVDSVKSITQDLVFPSHLLVEDAIKTGEEFDVNEYFSVLNYLSIQLFNVLDWVYLYDGMGGYPIIYAREVYKPPYQTYTEYINSFDPLPTGPWKIQYNYMDKIHVVDIAEGYFEFIVLRKLASQFYLWWHAGYNDHTIICDHDALEKLIEEHGDSWNPLPEQEARSLNYEPIIRFENSTVLVKIIYFTNWGGFIQSSYTISRDFPHEILHEEEEVLVEYAGGWVY